MLDIATRKELAALAYERAELETSEEHPIILADDGEHFGSTRRWYDALFRYPSTLAW